MGDVRVVTLPMRERDDYARPPSRSRPTANYKRLIIGADGTWLNSDGGQSLTGTMDPSNITRILRAIKPVSNDGVHQVVFYQFGVGTQGGVVSRVVGGATGEGIGDNIQRAYEFICNNYFPGDEIYLLGFSRGAFTVRNIAGLISSVGVLTKEGLVYLGEIFEDVRNRRNVDYRPKHRNVPFPNKMTPNDPRYGEELERRGLTTLGVRVKVCGVWDTVGSLGVPRVGFVDKMGVMQETVSSDMKFFDTKLSNTIENAFQALALDERRSAFSPAVWEKPPGNTTRLRQVWFPGVHSNIGGGYDDQQIANITLAWMIAQLDQYLDFYKDFVTQQYEDNVEYYREERRKPRPWSFGKIYNSMKGVYAVGGSTIRSPGRYTTTDPETGKRTSRPLRDTHEYVHPSVRSRFLRRGPGVDDEGDYECDALEDWKLVIDYGETGREEPRPVWQWRGRPRDDGFTYILPESPMLPVERELLSRDPEMYDFVMDPEPPRRPIGRR